MKSAESVSPNHPDKLCDRIADAILDACLEQDPLTRAGIEVMGSHGIISVAGELTTTAFVDCQAIVNKICPGYGVQVNIVRQSPEIARGVDAGGAGDQGVMNGYACSDNEDMIPQEHYLARDLCKALYSSFPYDGKTQITIDEFQRITAVVASFQNVEKDLLREMVIFWLNKQKHTNPVEIFCNPAGDWKQGGFDADTGVTGRKLCVDNYGTEIPIGGGAFSGKDATKVDRSAAYMARKMAVQMLKVLGAKEVFVQLAYAIGVADPVMVTIKADNEMLNLIDLQKDLNIRFQLKPKEIIELLDLRKPQFSKTAEFGHFGNGFAWDK